MCGKNNLANLFPVKEILFAAIKNNRGTSKCLVLQTKSFFARNEKCGYLKFFLIKKFLHTFWIKYNLNLNK